MTFFNIAQSRIKTIPTATAESTTATAEIKRVSSSPNFMLINGLRRNVTKVNIIRTKERGRILIRFVTNRERFVQR